MEGREADAVARIRVEAMLHGWEELMPVFDSNFVEEDPNRLVGGSVLALAKTVRLRTIAGGCELLDPEDPAHLVEDSVVELAALVGEQREEASVSHDPAVDDTASDITLGFGGERDQFGPGGEGVNHYEDVAIFFGSRGREVCNEVRGDSVEGAADVLRVYESYSRILSLL